VLLSPESWCPPGWLGFAGLGDPLGPDDGGDRGRERRAVAAVDRTGTSSTLIGVVANAPATNDSERSQKLDAGPRPGARRRGAGWRRAQHQRVEDGDDRGQYRSRVAPADGADQAQPPTSPKSPWPRNGEKAPRCWRQQRRPPAPRTPRVPRYDAYDSAPTRSRTRSRTPHPHPRAGVPAGHCLRGEAAGRAARGAPAKQRPSPRRHRSASPTDRSTLEPAAARPSPNQK
jgi:hypothetical protein